MNKKSFDEILREELNNYRGMTDPYIMNLPDFVKLLANLLDEDKLDSEDRKNICTALGYFVAPSDLIPESIYGPEGYVDDVYLCCFVLDRLIKKHGYAFVNGLWDGEEDLQEACTYTLKKAGEDLEKKKLRERLLVYVGMEKT